MTSTFSGAYFPKPLSLGHFFPFRSVNVRLQLCRNIKFNYCILDEGHVIKNGKTKLSKAVKQLAANFRVILSGTPIQVSRAGPWAVHACARVSDRQVSFLRTTSWSCGRSLTSSCRAFWERSGSLPLATESPSWPAATQRAPPGSRRQVRGLALPFLSPEELLHVCVDDGA